VSEIVKERKRETEKEQVKVKGRPKGSHQTPAAQTRLTCFAAKRAPWNLLMSVKSHLRSSKLATGVRKSRGLASPLAPAHVGKKRRGRVGDEAREGQ
jgi:hypothetical protein